MAHDVWVIRIVCLADGSSSEFDGFFVLGCDVDAADGYGDVRATPIESMARTFDSFADAMAYWQRQSTTHPLRMDGKPNRPLTRYTVEVRKGGTDAYPTAGSRTQAE